MVLLVDSSYFYQIYVYKLFTIEPGQIFSFTTGSLYGYMRSTYYTCFVNQSLVKIEMKINEINSKVLSTVKKQFLLSI